MRSGAVVKQIYDYRVRLLHSQYPTIIEKHRNNKRISNLVSFRYFSSWKQVYKGVLFSVPANIHKEKNLAWWQQNLDSVEGVKGVEEDQVVRVN